MLCIYERNYSRTLIPGSAYLSIYCYFGKHHIPPPGMIPSHIVIFPVVLLLFKSKCFFHNVMHLIRPELIYRICRQFHNVPSRCKPIEHKGQVNLVLTAFGFGGRSGCSKTDHRFIGRPSYGTPNFRSVLRMYRKPVHEPVLYQCIQRYPCPKV